MTADKLAIYCERESVYIVLSSEVPFTVYDSVLILKTLKPEDTFDQIIVEWNPDNTTTTGYSFYKQSEQYTL